MVRKSESQRRQPRVARIQGAANDGRQFRLGEELVDVSRTTRRHDSDQLRARLDPGNEFLQVLQSTLLGEERELHIGARYFAPDCLDHPIVADGVEISVLLGHKDMDGSDRGFFAVGRHEDR